MTVQLVVISILVKLPGYRVDASALGFIGRLDSVFNLMHELLESQLPIRQRPLASASKPLDCQNIGLLFTCKLPCDIVCLP